MWGKLIAGPFFLAVLFFILNIIGLGLGPTAVGMLSDWLSITTDVGQYSVKWGMVIAVCVVYPLCILWHLGARALPDEN